MYFPNERSPTIRLFVRIWQSAKLFQVGILKFRETGDRRSTPFSFQQLHRCADAVHVPKYKKIAHRQLHHDSPAANTTTLLFHWRTVRRIPVPWTRLRTPASHSVPKPGPNTIIPSGSVLGAPHSPPDAPLSLPSTSFPSHYSQITLSGGAIYRVTILSDNCHHCCTRLRVTAGSTALPPWVGLQEF